jgi:hypothetical protein
MEDEKHFPPGTEPELPASEAPQPESAEVPQDKPKPEGEAKPEGETPAEPEKEEAAKPEGEEEPPQLSKKRSIYDDLKDERRERKDAQAKAQTAEERAATAEAKAAELQALLDAKNDAKTPQEKSNADDELKTFAEAEGLSVEGLEKLVGIIGKRVSTPIPEEVQKTLAEFTKWQKTHKAQQEDQEILSAAPSVKTALDVHDDAELQSVMKEVVRLAHTPEFHDKEVDYIVWKNRDKLAKLVSPKKPSFESGTPSRAEGAEEKIDFGSGKVTPEQVEKALTSSKPSYEIRRAQ